MINAKEAYLRSQSPEVLEQVKKKHQIRVQEQLDEISADIEVAIQNNHHKTYSQRALYTETTQILESKGYSVTNPSGIMYTISWGHQQPEANDIIKDMLFRQEEVKEEHKLKNDKWWKLW